MISIIIPARNEIYLQKTLEDILLNAKGDIEIIVELDGYLPNPQISLGDTRVIFIHHEKSIGQRQCINHAALIAKGEWIMKVDAHCAFDEGFDLKLLEEIDPYWTVVPRMYNLDVETWKPKLRKLTDYMYISSPNAEKPFRAEYYTKEEYRRQHRNKKLIDDTMACMGPCWLINKQRFFDTGMCDEGHGSWGAQSVEVSLKAWLSGGALKVNKKTWFAHWFRGDVGFPYHITGRDVDKARKHSRDLWLNNKWPLAKRDLKWVVDKFNPPGWSNMEKNMEEKTIDIASINREIRKIFDVRISYDFPPFGTKQGKTRDLLPILWERLGYKIGAEIGVKKGTFSDKILSSTKNIILHSIDPWAVYKNYETEKEVQEKNYNATIKTLSKYGERSKIHRLASLDAVNGVFDESLDFVFIDGDHTFNACVQDIIKWYPKLKKGGMMAVHDYLPMRRGGVIEAVDAFTKCNLIKEWYVIREELPTAFWIKQ